MVPLTNAQRRALAAIQGAWPSTDVVLIGALALGHHISMGYRATDDLDLVVGVPIEDFPGPLASLPGWRRHEHMEHRFFSPDGEMLDVLPAGPALLQQGHITWKGGERMSLVGLDLALQHNTTEPTGGAGGTMVRVATAPVIAFLKMRAWLDRPEARKKDLRDIAHLLTDYIGDDDDRRFDDDLLSRTMDYEDVSPFALGRDLGRIATAVHLEHVEEFSRKATPEKLAAHGPPSWWSADDAERSMAAFRRGLEDA